MDAPFIDRWGKPRVPGEDAVIKHREGAFSCCVHDGHILLIWPPFARNVPELPGGGIDPGETAWKANLREVREETGFILSIPEVDRKHDQDVRFYAEDQNEYWLYRQRFYCIENGLDAFAFDGEQATPEKGTMRWVKLADLATLPLHAMHRKAVTAFIF